MNNTVYVTEMLRWGDDEAHHYILGVFDNIDAAEEAGEIERSWRGGKYEYKITPTVIATSPIDIFDDEQIKHHIGCTGEQK